MTRDLGLCLFCDAPAQELHHWTAALVPDGEYLDPAATVPLCIPCHHAEHAAWRELEMDAFTDPLEARLVRIAWLWQRLADVAEQTGPRILDATTQRGVHLVVVAIGTELAKRHGWEEAS